MNPEIKVAICAEIVALCALILTLWQACEIRRFNRVAVRPLLYLSWEMADQFTELGIKLKNVGLGPALISGFSITVDDTTISDTEDGGWQEARRKLKLMDKSFIHGWIGYGAPFASGESSFLLSIKNADLTEARKDELKQAIKRLVIKIEYQSMFGEKWTIKCPYSASELPLKY